MAAYSGTPTVDSVWELGDRNGKLVRTVKRLTLSLSSQGGATNNIPATALGFTTSGLKRVQCILFTDGSSQKRVVWCFTDGTYLYIGDPTNATDATRGIPGDVTGTLFVEVEGISS